MLPDSTMTAAVDLLNQQGIGAVEAFEAAHPEDRLTTALRLRETCLYTPASAPASAPAPHVVLP